MSDSGPRWKCTSYPIRTCWTCSDFAHHEHRYRWTAWLCGRVQKLWHAVKP